MNGPGSSLHLILSAAIACVVIAGCRTPPTSITSVTVRDRNFEVVKELSPTEISDFERLWRGRKSVPGIPPLVREADARAYQLDVRGVGSGARWLYDTSGRVRMLTIKEVSDYQVDDARAFNKLIGATP